MNRAMLTTGAVVLLSLLPGSGGGEVVRGPVLHASTDGSMTISWDTSENVIGELLYGLAEPDESAVESSPGTHHVITLHGLEPDSLYRYRIAGEAGTAIGGTFRAGRAGSRFAFTVAGDTRSRPFFHRVVLDRVLALRPDLHINTGDLVESGEEAVEWDIFFRVEKDLLRHVPFLPVIGNHDKDENTFYDSLWCLPGVRDNPIFFSLRFANALFLVLDYEEISDGSSAQDLWVVEQLERAASDPQIEHIFPSYHVPPLSSGPHGNAANVHMLGWLHQAFKEAGVKLVFNGHDHTYERSLYDGIYYIVAGGGGAPQKGIMSHAPPYPQERSQVFTFEFSFILVEVDGPRLEMSAFNMDNDRIDRIEVP